MKFMKFRINTILIDNKIIYILSKIPKEKGYIEVKISKDTTSLYLIMNFDDWETSCQYGDILYITDISQNEPQYTCYDIFRYNLRTFEKICSKVLDEDCRCRIDTKGNFYIDKYKIAQLPD